MTGWLSSSWWVGIAAIAGIVVAVATCAAVVVAVWIARRQQGLAGRLARIEEERHMLATRPVFSARLGHWSADVGSWIQPVIYVQNDGERAANDVHVLVTIGSYSSSFSRDRLARSDEPWEIRPQVAWAYVEEVPDPAAEANPSRPRAFLPATRPMFRWPLHVQIKHDREPGALHARPWLRPVTADRVPGCARLGVMSRLGRTPACRISATSQTAMHPVTPLATKVWGPVPACR